MRLLNSLLALPLTGVLALGPRQESEAEQPHGPVVASKKFIVEVTEGSNVDEVSAKVKANGGRILRTFKSDVFTGFSVESDAENVDTLQEVTEISRAWPMARINLAPITPSAAFSDDAAASNYSVHASTGVERVHEAGYFGKGAVVAIVDTGTWYHHPALGGGFGPGFKVAGGYDLVGDAYWPSEGEKEPDSDPLDLQGHGSHVAGIIAGKSEWYTGVAPEATLLSYKVFSNAPGTDEDTLIEAFLLAYDAGADIITSSIGGPSGWSTNPWGIVASRLVDLGVVVTISAGNDGEDGPFYASSGSSGKKVVAVASIDSNVAVAEPFQATFTLDGASNTSTLGYLPGFDLWELKGLPIIPISLDITNPADACEPLPADTPDLSGAIVLIRRGTCNFSVKQTNAAAFGAKYILFYNQDGRVIINPSSEILDPNIAMIEQKAGEAIVATVAAGGSVTAEFTLHESWKVGVFNSAGGVPSQYTTWGGTYDMDVKPDIGAPGRDILSTYLNGEWAVMSGTSMACPYVAGVAALYIGKNGGRSTHGPGFAKTLVDRIISSGAAIPWQIEQPLATPVDFGFWAPPIQVGGGMIDAWKVLNTETALAFDKIALNDTGHFNRYHDVYVTNNGDKPVEYKFSLQPAGGFNAQSLYPWSLVSWLEITPISIIPTVSFPSGKFTVKPGETKKAQFGFKQVEGLDAAQLPVYSGKVLISGSNGDELSVPYMGAAFDVKKSLRGALFSDTTPYQIGGVGRDDIEYFHQYSFNLSWWSQSFPKVNIELKWGSPQLRWDIYEAGWKEKNWKYPPVVGENGYVGSATYYAGSGGWAFDPNYDDKNNIIAFPVYDLFRSTTWSWHEIPFWWLGQLANGSYIQPGDYTFRFAALLPFSEPQHSDNWDIWKTPIITVLPLEI